MFLVCSFIFRGDRLKFVANHLKQQGLLKRELDKELMKRFLDSYLKQDGAFLLRLIAHNTNTITVTEITCGLWQIWRDRLEKSAPSQGELEDIHSEDSSKPKPSSPPLDDAEDIPLTRVDEDTESDDSIVKKPIPDDDVAVSYA